jgi:cytochrome P450
MTDATLAPDWGVTSFDPWDHRLNRSNVWEIYRRMRDQGPVVRSEAHGGYYLITQYEAVKAAAMDSRTFISGEGTLIGKKVKNPRSIPLETDRPEHMMFKKPMFDRFSPRRIGELEPVVQHHVKDIFDELLSDQADGIEVVQSLAVELPFRVISDLIGFDDEARARNKELSLAVVNEKFAMESTADRDYVTFLREQVAKNFDAPSGLLGDLVTMAKTDGAFTEDELIGMGRALGLAGFHTTINGIAAVVLRAADRGLREQYLGPQDDHARIRAFVEEAIRLDPPIHLEGRHASTDVVVGDVDIPAGAQVALVYASGNHDEKMFDAPERFMPGRDVPHLTFGYGAHACIGNLLARMEMRAVLGELLRRFPNGFELVDEPEDAGMVFGHHMGWERARIRSL